MTKQKLTPIKFVCRKKDKDHWLFRCECGNEVTRSLNTYNTNNTKSCGCLITNPPITPTGRAKDRTNQRFNRLLAIKRYTKRNKIGTSLVWYECLCDCGKVHHATNGQLMSGNTKSCGCLDRDTLIKRNKDPSFISKRNHKMNKKYVTNHWKTNEIIYCTGSWEYGTVLYLNQNRIDFVWQPVFELPNTRYICDIYLPNENKYIEVKGRWLKDAWDKLQLFRETFPLIQLEVWDRPKLFLLKIINNQGKNIMMEDLR